MRKRQTSEDSSIIKVQLSETLIRQNRIYYIISIHLELYRELNAIFITMMVINQRLPRI